MITSQQVQWMVERDLEDNASLGAIFKGWWKGTPHVDIILTVVGNLRESRRELEMEYLSQIPYAQWLLARCPYWIAAGIAARVLGGDSISDANHIATFAGQEPRHYFPTGEIRAMLNVIGGQPEYMDKNDLVPAESIRALGTIIQRHPSVFGQKDRPWKQVYDWATRESFDPFLRRLCLLYGDQISQDVSSPYRRVYVEVKEQPTIAILSAEHREERAKAAAVRAFLTEFYYHIHQGATPNADHSQSGAAS